MNKNNKNISLKGILCSVVFIVILVLLDQYTKMLAVTHLKGQNPIVLIQNVFQLEYVENRGAAFGILKDQRWIFYLCVLIVTVLFIGLMMKLPSERKFLPLRICGLFILSGAYGNMIDRVINNYVVDFLYFKLIDFPVFNVADIYVTCCCALLVILVLFYYKEEDFDRITH